MEGDSVDAAGDGDNFRLNVQSFTDQQEALNSLPQSEFPKRLFYLFYCFTFKTYSTFLNSSPQSEFPERLVEAELAGRTICLPDPRNTRWFFCEEDSHTLYTQSNEKIFLLFPPLTKT